MATANYSVKKAQIEREIIDYFVHLTTVLKLPRSLGELYGALFVSDEPLSMDALMDRLQLSKGATSQGLKILRSYGAVQPVYVTGDRRTFYAAERELRALIAGFIKEYIAPDLEEGRQRLRELRRSVERLPKGDRKTLDIRVAKLAQWNRRARQVLPMLTAVMKNM